MANIIVCGYLIRYPVAGFQLSDLVYILGLCKLGHKVFYFEDSGWDNSCYHPRLKCYDDDPVEGLRVFEDLLQRYGLQDIEYTYLRLSDNRSWGLQASAIKERIREADLLLNLAGICWLDEFGDVSKRAIIDKDPLFTQTGQFGYQRLEAHNVHFSYGTNLGRSDCRVPTLGYQWHPLYPPSIPDFITSKPRRRDIAGRKKQLTTIANWQAYGSVEYQGKSYGQKNEEFERLIDLPGKTSAVIQIATDNMPGLDQARFERAGWTILSGSDVSSTIDSYMNYICSSSAEFSVAKNAYVKSNSGWFSDRTVTYLAAGIPVIVQDTGFSHNIETGEGILAFSDMDTAVECIDELFSRYGDHCSFALELSENHFDYRKVLSNLLEIALG